MRCFGVAAKLLALVVGLALLSPGVCHAGDYHDKMQAALDLLDSPDLAERTFAAIEQGENVSAEFWLGALDRRELRLDELRHDGYTLLTWAVVFSNYAIVRELLDWWFFDPNQRDDNGVAPLELASGDLPLEHTLLSAGADPALGSRLTELHWAVWEGDAARVRQLLEQDAVVDNQDNLYEYTALQMACGGSQGGLELVSLLLRAGADPDLADAGGATALLFAAQARNPGKVRLLLEGGADPNRRDDDRGYTALHWAAHNGDTQIVRLLLAAGADPDAQANDRSTPQELAEFYEHAGITYLLYTASRLVPWRD